MLPGGSWFGLKELVGELGVGRFDRGVLAGKASTISGRGQQLKP